MLTIQVFHACREGFSFRFFSFEQKNGHTKWPPLKTSRTLKGNKKGKPQDLRTGSPQPQHAATTTQRYKQRTKDEGRRKKGKYK